MLVDTTRILQNTIDAKLIADSLHVFVEKIPTAPGADPSFFSIARDTVLIMTAITGAIVAIYGLRTWRK